MDWTPLLGGVVGALIYQAGKAIILEWRDRRRAAKAEASRIAESKFWR